MCGNHECVSVSLAFLSSSATTSTLGGRAATFLSDNAFAVYLFHPPILIAIALALHGLNLPVVAKFATLTILSAVASFGAECDRVSPHAPAAPDL